MLVNFGMGVQMSVKRNSKKIQYEAARIVTGLPRYASIESLLFETGWEHLSVRRERRKLALFYRIHNRITPAYLSDCLTPLVSTVSTYNLRNSSNYVTPATRLDSHLRSFFPSTIRLWNNLDIDLRNVPTIDSFKRKLKTNIEKPPSYYNTGQRKLNIIHTRLRHRSSTLKADLFRVDLESDQQCSCGWPIEDSIHFFLECPLYQRQRSMYIDTLDVTGADDKITSIFFGSKNICEMSNKNNFTKIHSYIQQSGRFIVQ